MNSREFLKEKNINILVALFFVAILLLVGILFRDRMGDLLIHYTESQTKRQAETLASLASEKLGTELENLAYVASKIESNPTEVDRIMPLVFNEKGIKQGLLAIDGKAVYGDALSLYSYDGIQTSFRGKSAISFVKGQGILFTCPVFHGKNVKYVLYRLYPVSIIGRRFSISCYDDVGRASVVTRDGDMIVPFMQVDVDDMAFIQSDEVKEYFRSMHREMEISVAAARAYNTRLGEMILFEAEIPGTDYLVVGFVPREKAAEGIGSLTRLVVWVFGLLMLLVALGTMYLFQMWGQIYESEELRREKAVAEEASQAKSNFLANMSHEIRTPINAVLGMNEMILRESRDKEIISYAESINTAGGTLLGIINDILDFSKIEAGRLEIIPVEYDLSVVLADLVNMIQTRADKKGLVINLEFDPETPKRLFGDEIRVKQIIMNILTNAVKYTEKGTVTFSVGFQRIEDVYDHVMLCVGVKDTGIGIKTEDLKKLFVEFERIEEKRNRHVEGTGLGLTITQNLLNMMGSSLQVESTYGEGSNFHFRLEQKVMKWDLLGDYKESYQALMRTHKAYREKFTAPEARVLVVDDNPMNLMVFKSLLKKTRMMIDMANDGDEGLSLTMKRSYDIIFLDHMMPRKDGIETLQELREQADGLNSRTPVICLTANAISGAREKYISAGFSDYLTKPVNSGQLEDLLLEFLPEKKIKKTGDGPVVAEETVISLSSVPEILAPLKDQSWIDISLGIKNSGDLEGYLPLLRLFYESLEDRAAEIDGLYEAGNITDYTIKVHALKSSARLVGAMAFGQAAQQLEDAGKNGDMEYIKEHHPSFMETYRSFKEPLSQVFTPNDQDTEKMEADLDLLEDAYGEIQAAAEDMNIELLENIFTELEEYRIPKQEADFYQNIKKAAERLDYDGILALLAER